MSFSSLPYDSCTYLHDLKESVKMGKYQLETPLQNDNACFYPNPSIRMNSSGVSLCKDNLIEVDSELLGLNVKQTKCPSKKFTPSKEPFCNLVHMKECSFLSTEDTKMSNPPCTLRGTGWNRWEWLCENPQDRSIIPFETDINNRLIVKDNHRPCIPDVLDADNTLTHIDGIENAFAEDDNLYKYNRDTTFPVIHWRCCEEINKL